MLIEIITTRWEQLVKSEAIAVTCLLLGFRVHARFKAVMKNVIPISYQVVAGFFLDLHVGHSENEARLNPRQPRVHISMTET
jgi:hypothetical protein